MVAHYCDLSTWEDKTVGWKIQVQLGLPSKFTASLGYVVKPGIRRKTDKVRVEEGKEGKE